MDLRTVETCLKEFHELAPDVKLPALESSAPSDVKMQESLDAVGRALFDPTLTLSVVKSCRPILIEVASRILDGQHSLKQRSMLQIEQIATACSLILPLAPQLIDSVMKFFTENRVFVDKIVLYSKRTDGHS